MPYATIALKPETKDRLMELRRTAGFRSMDEVVAAALDELEATRTATEVRKLTRRGSKDARIDALFAEAEGAMEGLDDTVRAVRTGWRKRLDRNPRA